MWTALAADAAAEHGSAHAAEPFYASAEFWVAIGFVIFVVAVARTAFRVIGVALDDRAEKIKSQLDEATRLADEAQQLLATYERKQREASDEAQSIVDLAQREADRLAEHEAQELERSLKRREELAMERIAQAEKAAINDIRGQAVTVAMEATKLVLAEQLTAQRANALIDDAIAELPKKLH